MLGVIADSAAGVPTASPNSNLVLPSVRKRRLSFGQLHVAGTVVGVLPSLSLCQSPWGVGLYFRDVTPWLAASLQRSSAASALDASCWTPGDKFRPLGVPGPTAGPSPCWSRFPPAEEEMPTEAGSSPPCLLARQAGLTVVPQEDQTGIFPVDAQSCTMNVFFSFNHFHP